MDNYHYILIGSWIEYCYFNSKYRGWKKELDQLAKSMQLLPGCQFNSTSMIFEEQPKTFTRRRSWGEGGLALCIDAGSMAPKGVRRWRSLLRSSLGMTTDVMRTS